MTKLILDGSWSSERNAVAGEILSYLEKHPQASDTLEGIVEWWLLQQKIEYQTKVVRDALAELIKRGFLVKEVTKDSRVRYRATENTKRVL
jgi:DNA-binding HxlR family transcriptional regulator